MLKKFKALLFVALVSLLAGCRYQYFQVSAGFFGTNIFWKSLVVTFDSSGIVLDVEYSSSKR